jgi:hypothetical protein
VFHAILYPFNWIDFHRMLLPIIQIAFRDGPPYGPLREFYAANFDDLRQPETGGPVAAEWKDWERLWDIQELVDVVLTDFYDPGCGLDGSTVREVPVEGESGGRPIAGSGVRFDPTGHGSLFWTDEELREMGADGLAEIAVGIQGATEMLEYCRRTQLGVYLRIVSRRTNA